METIEKLEQHTPCDVLPKAFLGTQVPAHVLTQIRALYGPKTLPFLGQLVMAWGVMITAILAAQMIHSWWANLLAVLIVASRQNILGLLVHDQAHKLGIRGRKGDIITNLFAGYPLLILSVENYAKVHLTHHRYYFAHNDPDHLRKAGPEWQVPKSKKELFGLFLRDLCGLSTIRLIRGKNVKLDSKEFQRANPTPKFIRPLFMLTLVSALTYWKLWPLFLFYWLLPLLTVFQVIVRWGALTEHIYNTGGAKVEENSPLILPSWLDRIVLPNLNFSYHAYHHWYPNVSFSKLPEVHRIYRDSGLLDETKAFHGYFSFLKFICKL
jgi:fatty acid desaturase